MGDTQRVLPDSVSFDRAEKGWMRAFRADEMQVVTAEGTVIIRGPILAISGNELSGDGRYRIILHPQHAGETYV